MEDTMIIVLIALNIWWKMTKKEKQEKAMDMAGDCDFSECDADYECEGVLPIKS